MIPIITVISELIVSLGRLLHYLRQQLLEYSSRETEARLKYIDHYTKQLQEMHDYYYELKITLKDER